jgi:hypothetical protein
MFGHDNNLKKPLLEEEKKQVVISIKEEENEEKKRNPSFLYRPFISSGENKKILSRIEAKRKEHPSYPSQFVTNFDSKDDCCRHKAKIGIGFFVLLGGLLIAIDYLIDSKNDALIYAGGGLSFIGFSICLFKVYLECCRAICDSTPVSFLPVTKIGLHQDDITKLKQNNLLLQSTDNPYRLSQIKDRLSSRIDPRGENLVGFHLFSTNQANDSLTMTVNDYLDPNDPDTLDARKAVDYMLLQNSR